ncbi:DUF4767 domain-containing protein [Lactobacillus intestinalis]|uniref:DUF4767 domain-containing protein n=1 Tax=Lactobacillus intestinalis TaxID=151781 RepID=A0A4S2BRP2_9LACO|nr:DUF4767 domain-containing protein [Lactobacillus intestinalis]TGY17718.1 DUF4767 domain-containing protein [Lactobacillus intestinalis]
MKKRMLVGITALLLTTLLTGCSNIKFDKDGIRFGSSSKVEEKAAKKSSSRSSSSSTAKTIKKAPVKPSKIKDKKKSKTSSKPKKKKKVVKKVNSKKKKSTASWTSQKDQQLNNFVASWSQNLQQQYQKYDGQNSLKAINGLSYPDVFTQRSFTLNNRNIELRWSPKGKNIAQYNVVAIYNDNFKDKNWHLTYLFCLHNKKPVVLLEQGHNTNPIIVTVAKDSVLKNSFAKIVNGR